MYDPTFNAASAMAGMAKCRKCQQSSPNWRGFSICQKSLSPKRCGANFQLRQDIVLAVAEGAFK